MRRLTVVQLLPALDAGGVERSTLEIAEALVSNGHRAIVVSNGGRMLPQLQAIGAEHVALAIGRKSPWTFRHVPALRRLFAEIDADIVHARSRLPAWLAWRALQGMRGPRPRFVTTAHGLNSPSRYSAIMARGERVICVSNVAREYLLQHYPRTDPQRLRVIPRGIDPARFPRVESGQEPDRALRARLSMQHSQLGGNGPLLLMPGRGTRLKGHADALDLLGALRADGMDARLWMPGALDPARAAYIDELQARAQAAGIADALAITAPTDAIAEAYAASDLVLQLSRKPEAFGRTVIEALAVGRPVLGWAYGGVGELLAQLQPEGAVVAFDMDALRQRARALLAHPPTPAATMPYTLQAMQRATMDVYRELSER
ncbi:glycosyltransferase family 4 protein [Thermomonas sp.]|uniref:glycosyltransferase family 4 protein n=1 Tax=Thermomonas sp. TaxID=1971895 RepID=UPI002488E8CA|nr:glycosyltransferase family 4 protein [Thermomonas sp.]MDI1252573.1 glycosyltransferase family 4 protein [Thermomonas sp.]